MNSDFSDIADALTESLARDGQGGMQAALPLDATGITYNNDTNTGIYRYSADTQRIKCGGADIVELSTTGMRLLTGTFLGFLPIGLGPLPWSGTVAPSLWLLFQGQTLLRASYPDLWTFAQAEIALGNLLFTAGNLSTTFTIADLSGRVPAGNDNSTGRLTTLTPNGNTLGAVGGGQSQPITQGNLPTINFTVNIPAGQGSHSHSITALSSTGGVNAGGGANFGTVSATNPSTLPAMSGTAASGGSDTPLPIVQPTIITNYIIYAGA